jgi:membrane protein
MDYLPEDDWLAQVDRNALAWLWRPQRPRTGPRAWLLLPLQVLYLALRSAYVGRLPFQASAMTFMTLLGLVPALAISFSVAKGLGYASELEKLLLNSEFTASQTEILSRIIGYVEQTQVGTLGAVGVAILLVTLDMTLASVEETFNLVWDVHQGRSWPRKFTDYLSVLAICPLFVLAATGAWAAFSSLSVVVWVQNLEWLGPLTRWGLSLGPLALLAAALVFIYLFLPNTRVPILPALLGGAVAALLWWGVQSVYIFFQIGVSRYNAIYGGFASLPLFFIWVQVSWMVLLIGNELARAAHVCLNGPLPRALEPKLQGARREWLGLRLLALVGRRFARGGPAYSPSELARDLAAPERDVSRLAADLAQAGIISLLDNCGVVQPARALEVVGLAEALEALRGPADNPDDPPASDPALDDLWRRLEQTRRKTLEGITLADLIKEIHP